MADSSDYIQLTLPTRLSSEQRQRMIASFTRNLAILNGPDKDAKGRTLAPAKAAAREAIKAIHKQIAGVGGRIDTQSSRYQFDPGTGEIKGIVGPPPKPGEAPPAAKSILTTDSHQIRIPLALNRTAPPAPSTVSTAVPSSLDLPKTPQARSYAPTGTPDELLDKRATVQQTLDSLKKGGLEGSAGYQAMQDEAARLDTEVAKSTPSKRVSGAKAVTTADMQSAAAAQPVPESVSSDIYAPAAAAIPQTPAAAPVPGSSKPTVPSDMEDLNADPTLAALAPPPAATQPAPPTAPAETPEMTRLRALLAEPEPPPPNFEPSIAQKIGYGLLAGFQGADKVEPLISGQRAQAAQKYVLARQTREETINNLVKLVSLQDEQAQQQAVLKAKTADLQAQIGQTAGAVNQLHADAAPVLNAAYAHLLAKPSAPGAADGGIALSNDPILQQRAALIAGQVQELQAAQKSLQAAYDQNPRFVSPEQIAFTRSRIDQLNQTLDKSMSEQIARLKENKLPEAITTQIAALDSAQIGAKQALNMITEGIGGPIESRFYNLPFVSIVSPGRAEQIGVLDSILQRISAEAARGSTGRLAEFETEVFPSIFLNSTLPVGTLTGRLKGLAAWSDAKAKMLRGQPGAQNEAERALAEAAGWAVVSHTKEGYPVWQSPQGLQYTEVPENP